MSKRKLRPPSAEGRQSHNMTTQQDTPSPEDRARLEDLRAAFLARMKSRDHEAMNVALVWASQGTTRLNGRLRVGDELQERPRREDLPLAARLREAGEAWYSPALVGVFLRLRPEPLAQRAGVTVGELDAWPPGCELQAYLEAVVEVLVKAVDAHGGDERRAAAWYLWCTVPEFDGRTADEMVRDGRHGAVAEYLDKRHDA